MKSFALNCLALAFSLILIEFGSFIFFTVSKDRFTFYDLSRYLLKPDELERVSKVYDRDLGWFHRFDSPFGERPRSVDYQSPLISTFGDSYTYGGQVDHQYTYQTYLSELLQADVYNFGVSAYGTGQAYLRFLRDYPKVKTKIVVLGFITENINRVVSVYRRFYYPPTGGPFTKPRFVLENKKLGLLKNPIQNKEDLRQLMELDFLPKVGEHDYWFNRSNYPLREFPYLRILFNKRMWMEGFYGKTKQGVSDIDARPWEDLWDDDPTRELFFAILDSFVRDARQKGAVPILMLLPRQREVASAFVGNYPNNAAKFNQFCEDRGYRCFDSITAFAKSVNSVAEANGHFFGHLTPKGNRLLAKVFYEYLDRQGILESEKPKVASDELKANRSKSKR